MPKKSSKEKKLFNNLLKTTEQFILGKGFKSQDENELRKKLSIPEQHHDLFTEVLEHLISSGKIEVDRGRYSLKQSSDAIIRGHIHVHPRGFGFVEPEGSSHYTQDIFIPKHLTKNAVDGDHVEVLVNQEVVSEKGPEGKVVAILSRGRTHIAGIIKEVSVYGDIVAHVPMLGAQQRVVVQPSDERTLQVGDRVVLEVVDWGSKETETASRFSHYIGHISDPSCDIDAAIEEYELLSDFPVEAIEEAERYGKRVSQKDIKVREDLRHLTIFTIDPDTAKDFDDALSLTRDKNGIYSLGVHIADVSHYVSPGTILDQEAQQRCNSTYFPRVCLPMLPGALSENLCSLKPNVNRLTVSVLMRFSPEGDLLDHRITRSVIHSVKRFTYREAKKVLDGKKASPHRDTLDLMVELCHLLKKKRYERGSIEFSLPELVVMVDEKGVPTGTDYIAYDVTHQLVEEFMLKANEIVAFDLFNKGKNLTYRIHEEPAEENLRDFALLAGSFGFRLPDKPSPQDLQKLFEEAADSPYATHLANSYIRRMRLAIYSRENIGHYGLSLTHYCHFTSPIRRYVDLVVHRILFGESDHPEYIEQIASQCSEQERISAKAESSVVVLKKLRLLDDYIKQDPNRQFEAIVTKIKNFGLYFEITELFLEGFLHISELGEDYYVYEESHMRLKGRHHGSIFAAGTLLTVMPQKIDLITLDTRWYLVDVGEPIATVQPIHEKGKKKSKKAPKSKQEKKTKISKTKKKRAK